MGPSDWREPNFNPAPTMREKGEWKGYTHGEGKVMDTLMRVEIRPGTMKALARPVHPWVDLGQGRGLVVQLRCTMQLDAYRSAPIPALCRPAHRSLDNK